MASSAEAELRRKLYQMELTNISMMKSVRCDRVRSGLEVMKNLVDLIASTNRSAQTMAKAANIVHALESTAAQMIELCDNQSHALQIEARNRYQESNLG